MGHNCHDFWIERQHSRYEEIEKPVIENEPCDVRATSLGAGELICCQEKDGEVERHRVDRAEGQDTVVGGDDHAARDQNINPFSS